MAIRIETELIEFLEELEHSNRNKINAVGNIMKESDFEDLSIHEMKGRTRAFIKIQEGCNQFCSYCIIPYARGPIRSRRPESVLREIKKLAALRYKEIVLTGIHVASYGKDLEDSSLIQLIHEIHGIQGIKRIRLSSLEPTLLTKDFLVELSQLPKFCPHFHISLQSGSDTILRAMKRKYTALEYAQYVENVRAYFPQAAITTDIMVGFPGESHDEFIETYNFVRKIAFSKIHVFKYSPRRGTPAAKYPNQINGKVKEERSKQLIALSKELEMAYYRRFLDEGKLVLSQQEDPNRRDYSEGLTDNYIRVIAFRDKNIKGSILPLHLESVYEDHMEGKIYSIL